MLIATFHCAPYIYHKHILSLIILKKHLWGHRYYYYYYTMFNYRKMNMEKLSQSLRTRRVVMSQ